MTTQQFIDFAQSHRGSMLALARQYLPSANDGEDVVQEVMLKLWTIRTRIDSDEGLLRYSTTAVRHTALNMLRNQRRHQALPLDDDSTNLPTETHSADSQMELAERQRQLAAIIAQLSVGDRTIIKMRSIDQLSFAQIAEMLGIAESSVRVRISRIRKTLLQQIKHIEL